MLWVGLRCVIVVFPDHTHLLFDHIFKIACICNYCLLFNYTYNLLVLVVAAIVHSSLSTSGFSCFLLKFGDSVVLIRYV